MEKPEQDDVTLKYMELLRVEVATGKADPSMYAELYKSMETYCKKMRKFNRFAPKYDGNPKKVFDWCQQLENHLSNFEWEQISNDGIKKMLLGCIEGLAQQEIVILQPEGLVFNSLERGEFFQELLRKFSHEKDKEGRKMEYISRNQSRNEDARKYYIDKLRLWVQGYPPARRSLV